ncbi:MAG: FCD domain-containing protein [Trueperaceae bacterium]|nr:FCD domain-containing protein [Trueperaceae bacterium]
MRKAGGGPEFSGRPANVLTAYFSNVVLFDKNAVAELLEVREALETYAVRFAARDRSDTDLERLITIQVQMAEHIFDDKAAFIDEDVEFHRLLVQMSGNTMLTFLVQGLRDATKESIARGLEARRSRTELESINQAHHAILEAIRDRNEVAAVNAMHSALPGRHREPVDHSVAL